MRVFKKLLIDCTDFCKELDIPEYELEEKMDMVKDTIIFLQYNGAIMANFTDIKSILHTY